MDDLLDDENSPMTTQEQEITATPSQEAIQSPIATTMAATAQDPFTQDVPNMPAIVVETKAPVIAPKKSLTKSLAMAAAGLFAVVVIGFIVVTMFPAGIDGPENGEEIVVQEPIIEEPEVQHTVAQEKTLQEIAREQLVDYSVLGEEYYTLARELKDRDMLRYALYVEKKTKDLIELLDLDPNMDTKDIVVYFAQFDDYLETLADWKAGLGDMIPVQTSDSSLIGDDLSQ